jgi:molecular chaperone HscB
LATQPQTRSAELAANVEAVVCWSCGSALLASEHFCPRCGKVQRPQALEYFNFFGLPRKLNINLSKLEKDFYRLSRKLHPDLYVRATAHEQEWSLEKSSRLNDAYRTLKDPIARTQYLLSLEGVQLEEQSKAATDRARQTGEEKKQVVPPDLLEEVFELNMQLQELKMGGEKDPEVVARLKTAKNSFEARLEAITTELKLCWDEWDRIVECGEAQDDSKRVAVRDQMVGLLNRRSYIRNLVRDVNESLEA